MRRFTKRPLLLVLAVLILLDIASVQTVLSRDKKEATTPPAASVTHTVPGVVPVTVAPPTLNAGDAPAPTTPSPEPTATPSPEPTATPTPTPTPKADEPPGSSTGSNSGIQITGDSFSGRPYETVGMEGTYSGSSARTVLRVQHRQDGEWQDFPLPTTTDESGHFTVYVELGTTGEHQVRVVDPQAHIVSKPVTVVIR